MKDFWVDDSGQIHRNNNDQQRTSVPSQSQYTPPPIPTTRTHQDTHNNDLTTYWVVTSLASPIIYAIIGYFIVYPIWNAIEAFYISQIACCIISALIGITTTLVYNFRQNSFMAISPDRDYFLSLIIPLGVIAALMAVVLLFLVIVGIVIAVVVIGALLGG